jgi:hypothetical protein
VKAASDTVEFQDLPYGYYLITSTLGTTVTINSNTPNVEVIDKNQEPVPDFDKQVQTGVDENGDPIWSDANSAGIGDGKDIFSTRKGGDLYLHFLTPGKNTITFKSRAAFKSAKGLFDGQDARLAVKGDAVTVTIRRPEGYGFNYVVKLTAK